MLFLTWVLLSCVQIDAINDKFVEARDEIDYAKEDAETTYFDESYAAAQQATKEVRGMSA